MIVYFLGTLQVKALTLCLRHIKGLMISTADVMANLANCWYHHLHADGLASLTAPVFSRRWDSIVKFSALY